MSPSRSQIETLKSQLNTLDAEYQRHRGHMQRTMKYYDEAPDGSHQKQDAVDTMSRIRVKMSRVETQMSDVADELIALGAYDD